MSLQLHKNTQYCNAQIFISPWLKDLRVLRMTQNVYILLLTHTKKLLLVTYFDTTIDTGVSFWMHGRKDGNTDGRTDGQTDVEVKIVI